LKKTSLHSPLLGKNDSEQVTGKTKRRYEKPGFQYEKVFETMALACGKLSATQRQCRFNRKNS
jgi:hypothetical protein